MRCHFVNIVVLGVVSVPFTRQAKRIILTCASPVCFIHEQEGKSPVSWVWACPVARVDADKRPPEPAQQHKNKTGASVPVFICGVLLLRISQYTPAAAPGLERILDDGDAGTVLNTDEVFKDLLLFFARVNLQITRPAAIGGNGGAGQHA
jgi:hypothetical protein